MAASGGGVAVLFSGSPASALSALRAGERASRVDLLLFVGRGLRGEERVRQHLVPLGRFYGDAERYRLHELCIDGTAAALHRHRRLGSTWRYGLHNLAFDRLLPIAFHARAMLFCAENGVRRVAAVGVEHERTDERLRILWARLGVTCEPAAADGSVAPEAVLHALRYHRHASVAGTDEDREVTSDLRAVARHAGRALGRERGGDALDGLLAVKLDLLEEWVEDLRANGGRSRLAGLAGPPRKAGQG